MEPRTVVIGANTYLIGRLNALDQSDLALELAPGLARAQPVKRGKGKDDAANVMEVLGIMPREQRHEIFALCLKAVRRRQGEHAMPFLVPNTSGLVFAFQDLAGGELVRLVMEVVTHNLANFMPGDPSPTGAPPPA